METNDILEGNDITLISNEKLPFQHETVSHNDFTNNTLTIKEVDLDQIFDKWAQYVLTNKTAHVFSHPLWIKALEKENNRKAIILVCLDHDSEIKGILPLMPTLGLPFKMDKPITSRRLSSLPRTPLGGLLFDDSQVKKSLIQAAIKKLDTRSGSYLQLKSYLPCLNEKINNLSRVSWRSSFYLELPDDPEKIRFGDKEHQRKVNWAVNKARSLGITLRTAETESDLKEWYKLYLEVMRWHTVAARPFRFFKFLQENLTSKNMYKLLLAEQTVNNKKVLLAGSIFLNFNDTVFYSFNGRNQDALSYHANDLIQWEAIHDACKEGFKFYDMGEVSQQEQGLAQFKSKWGCTTKPIYHYYHHLNNPVKDQQLDFIGDIKLAKQIWRKLPLSFTQMAGNLTNWFL